MYRKINKLLIVVNVLLMLGTIGVAVHLFPFDTNKMLIPYFAFQMAGVCISIAYLRRARASS